MKLKATKRNTGVRKRSKTYCLNANDQIKAEKLKKCLICCILKYQIVKQQIGSILLMEKLNSIIINLGKVYLKLVYYDETSVLERPMRKNRTIESFEFTSANQLRFEYQDLYRLKALLQIPENVIFDNGSKLSGEEVFLRGLYELANGCCYLILQLISVLISKLRYFINYYCVFNLRKKYLILK